MARSQSEPYAHHRPQSRPALRRGAGRRTAAAPAAFRQPSVARRARLRDAHLLLHTRLEALNKRFRDHTNGLFVKQGMELVGYWMPIDKPDVLVYILAYPSRAAAAKAWAAFRADPDWIKARTASETDGAIVQKVESVYLSPTDYSAIK